VDRARAAYAFRLAYRSPIGYVLSRRERKGSSGQQLLEHVGYSRGLLAMRRALQQHPDLLIDFGLHEESVVVDGGAYVGNWSERVARKSGAQIFAFEPNPRPLEKLYERTAKYPNITVFEYGLGVRNETLTITLQGPGSSFFPDNYFAKKRNVDVTTAQVRDVAEVFEELAFDHIDLLALNIEGSEYDVLPRLVETGWIARIDAILIQFHEWLPHAHRRRRTIQRMLRQTHTQLWDYPWVWEAWRRRTQASADPGAHRGAPSQ
jgi:FkbM family methyltransferase